MPATSQAQFRAMEAAKSGHSTLGIPASVGAEFAAATPTPSALPKRAPSALEAHTGLSGKKKTRRGGGRHKGGKASDPKAQEHMDNMAAHLAVGNLDGVKKSALALANHLHRASKQKAKGSGPNTSGDRAPGTLVSGAPLPSQGDQNPSFAQSGAMQAPSTVTNG